MSILTSTLTFFAVPLAIMLAAWAVIALAVGAFILISALTCWAVAFAATCLATATLAVIGCR